MDASLAYAIFAGIAALLFALPRPGVRPALLLVLLGGWALLPVGDYPPGAPGDALPWWITGTALPSDMLRTKAWVVPLVALTGALAGTALRDPATLPRWRPAAIDLPMAAWCLWPLFAGLAAPAPGAAPPPVLAAAYVAGVWGLPWLIGRIWFADAAGALALLRGVALSGLALLPVALLEGVRPAWLYDAVYAAHPFRRDGVERYIGYRPVGFFEHGNLYGLWIALAALAALAALWLARHAADRRWRALAAVNLALALAAQSAAAIVLLAAGLVLLRAWRRRALPRVLAVLGALAALAFAVHLAGLVPLQALARSAAGERTIAALRAIGRGSLLWRVSQDAKSLATIAAHPLAGTARWDWWREYGTRPWGQPVLLAGQFGLIGLALAWGALLAAAGAALARLRAAGSGAGSGAGAALPLAVIVLLALADALLNAFFFAPAIVAAGAIAAAPRTRDNRTPRPESAL